ncbi:MULTISPECIES: D-glycero-beta-D-manno-heptose 1,7-bisphosphate 7-phosphatase [unclassified Campylobacter]|uniref:D-glycero-beta-D-manno-heptose 1,7-bisphosphate 7-phosphatase n=1 Tax=unclassified Campylobacter TaxID=2593542 RepID=UPI003D3371F0
MKQNKALFLDRDGVINEDHGYVYRVEDFKFIDGVFEALREFSALGYILVVVTNQSGIGRGYYTLEDFYNLTKHMLKAFEKEGIEISKVCFCPHAPEEECECRKPKPKMITDAAAELNINLKDSIMIGDKQSDIKAAQNACVGQSYLLDGVNFTSVKDVYEKIKSKGLI